MSLINAVVSKEDQVSDIVLLNPYNNKDHTYDRLSILDIKATDKYGRQYNIEMQITDQVYYNQHITTKCKQTATFLSVTAYPTGREAQKIEEQGDE